MHTFGSRLKAAIAASEYNQTSLGEAVGRSKGTVSQWCNDETEPDIRTLAKVCELVKTSADWLVRGVDTHYLEAEAIRVAGRMQQMSPEARAALYEFLFGRAVPDSEVERLMPITSPLRRLQYKS